LSNDEKNTGKQTDLTPEEVKRYLSKLTKAIIDDKYIISKQNNRKENVDFIEDYSINTKKEKEILLGLQFDDFCYAASNTNEGYEHEVLYIFCKCQELNLWGTLENVDIYIKINMTQTWKGDDYVIVISFHKRNKPIKYLFK
jgi:hypothetical protein